MFTSDWGSFFKQARKNIFGIIICISLFLAGFFIHGNTGLYVNLSGFLIIIGGTLGATFLSYNMKRIEILFKVLKTSYGRAIKSPNEIVRILERPEIVILGIAAGSGLPSQPRPNIPDKPRPSMVRESPETT